MINERGSRRGPSPSARDGVASPAVAAGPGTGTRTLADTDTSRLDGAFDGAVASVSVPPDLLDRVAGVRRRRRRRGWAAAVAAVVVVGSAGAIKHARAYTYPTLPALRAAPISGSGVLSWPARGGDAGNEYVVRAALKKLRSAAGRDKPTTALHLIYAGSGITVLAGRTDQGRPALAEVTRDSVRRSLLTTGSPPALTLPVAVNVVRFLVAPSSSTAGPTTVFYEDPASTGFNGFVPLQADSSGLTDVMAVVGLPPHFVVIGSELGPDGNTVIDRVRGDGTVLPASLIPGTPRVRFGSPPWPGASVQPPTTSWINDAAAIAGLAPARTPVTVATLVSGDGTNGAGAPGTVYSSSLYAVSGGGHDYVGSVLETNGSVSAARLIPVSAPFARLPVVGDRFFLPGHRSVIVVAGRPDVARSVMDVAAGGGRPAQRLPTVAFDIPAFGMPAETLFLARGSPTGPVTLTAYGRDGRRLGEYRIPGG